MQNSTLNQAQQSQTHQKVCLPPLITDVIINKYNYLQMFMLHCTWHAPTDAAATAAEQHLSSGQGTVSFVTAPDHSTWSGYNDMQGQKTCSLWKGMTLVDYVRFTEAGRLCWHKLTTFAQKAQAEEGSWACRNRERESSLQSFHRVADLLGSEGTSQII